MFWDMMLCQWAESCWHFRGFFVDCFILMMTASWSFLKQWELLAHWCYIISQKTQIFSNYCCDLISRSVCLFTHYGDMKLATIFIFTKLQSVRNRKYVTGFYKWSCLLTAYFTNDKICPMFTYCFAICTEEQRKTVRNLLQTFTLKLKTVFSMIQNSDLQNTSS